MTKCKKCKKKMLKLAYTCSHCGRDFCADHRLPEKHDCKFNQTEKLKKKYIERMKKKKGPGRDYYVLEDDPF